MRKSLLYEYRQIVQYIGPESYICDSSMNLRIIRPDKKRKTFQTVIKQFKKLKECITNQSMLKGHTVIVKNHLIQELRDTTKRISKILDTFKKQLKMERQAC